MQDGSTWPDCPCQPKKFMFFIGFPGKFGEISYDEFATFLEMGKPKGGGWPAPAFLVPPAAGSFLGDFKSGELFRIFKAMIQLQPLQLVEILQILQQMERRDGALAKKWQLVLLPLEVGRWAIKPGGC